MILFQIAKYHKERVTQKKVQLLKKMRKKRNFLVEKMQVRKILRLKKRILSLCLKKVL